MEYEKQSEQVFAHPCVTPQRFTRLTFFQLPGGPGYTEQAEYTEVGGPRALAGYLTAFT